MGLYENRIGEYRNLLGTSNKNAPFLIEQLGTDYCKKDYEITRENTEICVIGFTMHGAGIIIQDGKEYITEKGSIFILKTGSTHDYKPKENWSFMWFNIINNINLFLDLFNIIDNVVFFLPNIETKFNEVISHCLIAHDGLEYAQTVAQSFILSLLPQLKFSLSYTKDSILSVENQLKINLEREYATEYNFDNICNSIGVTVRSAQRLFKQKFNFSPHEYVLNLRFNEACSLLMNANLTIKQISFLVGFNNPKYFSLFFKSKSNLSPLQYRRAIKK